MPCQKFLCPLLLVLLLHGSIAAQSSTDTGMTAQGPADQLMWSLMLQYLAFGGLLLSASVAIILFFTARFRRRAYEELSRRNAEIEQQKSVIEQKNEQNEILVREIHHRVKNNLQVISSLLSLQSAQLTDESALAAMQTSHSRVRSMALLHQNLYQGHRFTTVDMEAYVDQLIDGISEIYGLDEDHRIQIDNEVFEIELDVDVAAPVGLVINELVTNAIKYAFPGERTGRITIDLREAEGEEIVLEVADDGVGIGQAEPSVESTCFGTRLLGILAKKLSGTLEIEDRLGTRVRLSFPAVSPLHSTLVGARPFDVPADEENHRDDRDDVE